MHSGVVTAVTLSWPRHDLTVTSPWPHHDLAVTSCCRWQWRRPWSTRSSSSTGAGRRASRRAPSSGTASSATSCSSETSASHSRRRHQGALSGVPSGSAPRRPATGRRPAEGRWWPQGRRAGRTAGGRRRPPPCRRRCHRWRPSWRRRRRRRRRRRTREVQWRSRTTHAARPPSDNGTADSAITPPPLSCRVRRQCAQGVGAHVIDPLPPPRPYLKHLAVCPLTELRSRFSMFRYDLDSFLFRVNCRWPYTYRASRDPLQTVDTVSVCRPVPCQLQLYRALQFGCKNIPCNYTYIHIYICIYYTLYSYVLYISVFINAHTLYRYNYIHVGMTNYDVYK